MNFKISNREVGYNSPVFIIAELSANHNQDFNIAVNTIKAMKEAGADAVKLQTYTPDTMTINCDNEYFRIKQGTIWDGKTLYELYKEAYTPWDWQPKLKKIAEDLGLIFFSTPFDKTAVDFLDEINVPVYKVASFEITDIPLIKYIASKGKPIIISTGIAEFDEINDAVKICRGIGNNNIALLKCTSAYPAPIEDANLKMIKTIEDGFNVIAGLSDHTIGNNVSIAAVALGAKIIERHFILDRNIGGPDAPFSLDPDQFKCMVNGIREVEKALGEIDYSLSDRVKKNRIFSRSLFIVRDIKKGDILTDDNIKSIRPGYGLAPKYLHDVLGKRVLIDIKAGTPFKWGFIESENL